MLVAQLYLTLCNPMVCPWDSLGKNTGVVAIPFSRGSFWPRDRIEVSCITGRFLTIWDTLLSGTKGKKNVLKCVISLLLDRLSASWGRDLNVYHLDLSRAYILPAFGEFIIWKVETKQKIKKKKKKETQKRMLCSPWSLCLWPFCTPKSPCLAGVESLAQTVLPIQGAQVQSWSGN